ncbi:hypothetical protein ACQ4PT_028637 [Festuca glaucescens]
MIPSDLPFLFLEGITNNFSDNQRLGSGGYGDVYKGVDKNGKEIAVKRLYSMPGIDDVQFRNELKGLMKVRHPTIVRLVGYCYNVRYTHVEHDGDFVLAQTIDRILCLEYLPGGSLDRYLSEESCGHDWSTRYKIIKGICQGLSYLHSKSIVHRDLKPGNVLLDERMNPKIADFGLSRLSGGSHTQITKQLIGTDLYMAPEYKLGRISTKSDVFSLGIMIVQIIAGKEGYSKLAEMSPDSRFIEIVNNNWKNRIEAAPMYPSREEDCRQVKRCIELALDCVKTNPDMRPTASEIVNELKKVETKGSTFHWDQARPAKIGMWGGGGGGHVDIEVAPRRLKSLRLGSGKVIYSLEFSYYDHDGRVHTAGPWGGLGPEGHGTIREAINFSSSEFITEVYGTICPFGPALTGSVKSLTIITNMERYGPFGEVEGDPFRIPVQDNGDIVGFFGRVGWYVDAIGVYANPKEETEVRANRVICFLDIFSCNFCFMFYCTQECGLAKIGPWGANGGQVHDITMAPHRLESVTVCSGPIVDSLMFTYRDNDGRPHTAGPWGRSVVSAQTETIKLNVSEYLTGVYGTTGPFAPASSDVVTSLTFITNEGRRFGPYGKTGRIPFQIEMWDKGSIVGFFGYVDSYLNAIGVYATPHQEAMREEPGYTKIGPWGGLGGNFQDMPTNLKPYRLESMTISSGAVINSLSFSYMDFNGHMHTVGPWGIPSGNIYTIKFDPLELLKGVHGTVGPFGELPNVITSLTFATNHARAYGTFGQGGGTRFNAPAEKDGCIVGFFGHAGSCLESLGVYLHRY